MRMLKRRLCGLQGGCLSMNKCPDWQLMSFYNINVAMSVCLKAKKRKKLKKYFVSGNYIIIMLFIIIMKYCSISGGTILRRKTLVHGTWNPSLMVG